MRSSVLAIVIVGCVSEPPLDPIIYVRAQGFSELERAELEEGSRQWRRLGFDVRDPRDEASPPTEGVYLVRFERVPATDEYDARTLLGSNRILVSGDTLLPLLLISAHEMGHYVLHDAAEHAPEPEAVMNAHPRTDRFKLTEADRLFACRIAERCDWY